MYQTYPVGCLFDLSAMRWVTSCILESALGRFNAPWLALSSSRSTASAKVLLVQDSDQKRKSTKMTEAKLHFVVWIYLNIFWMYGNSRHLSCLKDLTWSHHFKVEICWSAMGCLIEHLSLEFDRQGTQFTGFAHTVSRTHMIMYLGNSNLYLGFCPCIMAKVSSQVTSIFSGFGHCCIGCFLSPTVWLGSCQADLLLDFVLSEVYSANLKGLDFGPGNTIYNTMTVMDEWKG